MCGEAKEGEESLHPLTHPPTFVLFRPIFFKDLLFLWLVSTELFSNKTGKKPVGMGRLHCVALTGQL